MSPGTHELQQQDERFPLCDKVEWCRQLWGHTGECDAEPIRQ